ncbi:MAG TPA: DMT family transporter [bacterium]|nr:DMT family transporter [bacterium]
MRPSPLIRKFPNMYQKKKSLLADLSIGLIAFIWGTTFTVVKNALTDIGPFTFLFLRFAIAAIIILPLILQNTRWKNLPFKAGCMAGFFLFVGFSAQTIGLQFTTASKSGFITGLNVVFVPIFVALFEKKRLGKNALLAVLLAVTGLYLLTNPRAQSFNAGDAWTILCAVGFALHIVTLDYYTRKIDYIGLFFLQIIVVGALSGFLIPLENPGFFSLEYGLPGNVVIALGITGVFATALAFFIQNWAQRITTATRTALLLTLEPVFAALTAYVMLRETLGIMGIIGAALILLGIITAELRTKGNSR